MLPGALDSRIIGGGEPPVAGLANVHKSIHQVLFAFLAGLTNFWRHSIAIPFSSIAPIVRIFLYNIHRRELIVTFGQVGI